jgi:hypothetical protein
MSYHDPRVAHIHRTRERNDAQRIQSDLSARLSAERALADRLAAALEQTTAISVHSPVDLSEAMQTLEAWRTARGSGLARRLA